jgi:hypothetical protein
MKARTWFGLIVLLLLCGMVIVRPARRSHVPSDPGASDAVSVTTKNDARPGFSKWFPGRIPFTIDVLNERASYFVVPGSHVDVTWSPPGEPGYLVVHDARVCSLDLACNLYYTPPTTAVTLAVTPDQEAQLRSHLGSGIIRMALCPEYLDDDGSVRDTPR